MEARGTTHLSVGKSVGGIVRVGVSGRDGQFRELGTDHFIVHYYFRGVFQLAIM